MVDEEVKSLFIRLDNLKKRYMYLSTNIPKNNRGINNSTIKELKFLEGKYKHTIREIREKIEQRNQLDEEIADWFQENVDVDGCDIKNAYVVDEPKGEEQIEEGEYCKQTILGEDWYIGQYYWKMDNGKYLCMDFEI